MNQRDTEMDDDKNDAPFNLYLILLITLALLAYAVFCVIDGSFWFAPFDGTVGNVIRITVTSQDMLFYPLIGVYGSVAAGGLLRGQGNLNGQIGVPSKSLVPPSAMRYW